MSILEHCLRLYKTWHEYLGHIPKASRYALGEKIDKTFIEFFELVFIASKTSKNEKYTVLQKANSKLELLKLFLQVLWEVKSLDTKKYAIISASIAEIGRMLGGWLKQSAVQSHPPFQK